MKECECVSESAREGVCASVIVTENVRQAVSE